jgi:hypothetical protein
MIMTFVRIENSKLKIKSMNQNDIQRPPPPEKSFSTYIL